MDVFLANEQEIPVDEVRLSALARHTLQAEEVTGGGELSVLFVTPGHIRRLNARFAGDDYATDVLAFPMMEDDEGGVVLGDVVICPKIAQKNAKELGHSLDKELDALLVHGTLHLLGYDHEDDEDKADMDKRMRAVLRSFQPSRR